VDMRPTCGSGRFSAEKVRPIDEPTLNRTNGHEEFAVTQKL
jgi:hypothetical protein